MVTTGTVIEASSDLTLRILYLEDEPNDAELVQATLLANGVACELTRVDSRSVFVRLLKDGGWDLIFSDYTLPAFDGISALRIAKEICPDVPFIFVSGTLGEELAIEALNLGATDYVFKTRLSRISPSVQRASREARERYQRKLAEHALRRNEAYLAEAQRLSHTGSFGWDLTDGRVYWSEESFRIFGFDLTTQPSMDRVLERTHPDDRSAFQQLVERVSRERQNFDFEHRLLMPDGTIKHLRVVGRPSTDDCGFFKYVGAFTDISETRRAEEELQHLVDFVPQVIIVLDSDGKGIHANRIACEYTGLTLNEYRSADIIRGVIHPDDAERVRSVRDRGLLAGGPFEVDARLLGKDGTYRWFLFRYNPWLEQGAVKRWYGTATEIESRKQEEQRVRTENVRLEERTRIAQELHDTLLQTFLSASMLLTVAVDLIPQELEVKPLLDRILQIMRHGIQEGRDTIQDLRSPDSSSSGLVEALSRVQHEVAIQPDVRFRVKVFGQQRPLRPSAWHEIYRIAREALFNAFSHSHAKSVDLELECDSRQLRVRVRDNGRGIDLEVLQAGRDGHWGLAGMRERANRIGGELTISSSARTGTDVQLFIPSDVAFSS